MDDAFLAWYDAQQLRIVPNNYSIQINSVKEILRYNAHRDGQSMERVQQKHQRLLAETEEHAIPDALPRAPVNDPTPDDIEEPVVAHYVRSYVRATAEEAPFKTADHPRDPITEEIRKSVAQDNTYSLLYDTIISGLSD